MDYVDSIVEETSRALCVVNCGESREDAAWDEAVGPSARSNDELTKRCVYLCSVICKERETERLAIRGGA